jgi:hypothetical protein
LALGDIEAIPSHLREPDFLGGIVVGIHDRLDFVVEHVRQTGIRSAEDLRIGMAPDHVKRMVAMQ